jgi:hypothetical protein
MGKNMCMGSRLGMLGQATDVTVRLNIRFARIEKRPSEALEFADFVPGSSHSYPQDEER